MISVDRWERPDPLGRRPWKQDEEREGGGVTTTTTATTTSMLRGTDGTERERERGGGVLLFSSLGAPMQYARDPGFDNKGSLMQARQVCVYANEGEGR